MRKKLKILAAGDIHGDLEIAIKLSEKAKREKVDLVVLAGDINGFEEGGEKILEPFTKAKQKILFVPGNWESEREHLIMKRQAKSIDNYYVTYNDVGIAGIGNENWKFRLDENDLKKIKKNFEMMKPKKKILVSHLHAKGTKAESLGFLGDAILRKSIDELKPDILISAHIHEIEGMEDKIGKTKIFQVGRKGKILEI